MFDLITTICTNLFRTFLLKKFMYIFFDNRIVNKTSEWALYCSFYVLTGLVYLLFHFPPATIGINIVIIYIITQIYEGDQRKKVLVTVLVYGINMICDILAIFSLSDYIVGKEYNEVAVYITVFLISICEFIAEKFAMKNKKTEFAPPYWNILFFIPVISIIVLLVLIMCNLKNRIALVTVSAGILFINMLIFFLYHTLVNIYIKLEENAMFERQAACYSNQLDVLMQSEEKINALRHDMKHHLNELLIIANKSENCQQEIINYSYFAY